MKQLCDNFYSTISFQQARCGYIVLILTFYWVFEVIPLPVTSLLPLILFPMVSTYYRHVFNVSIYVQAGVLKAEDVAPFYFKDIIALFFGSLSFAYAVESVNLHRRIALLVLSRLGTSMKWYCLFKSKDFATSMVILS